MKFVLWKMNVQYVDQREMSTWWIIQWQKRIMEVWHLKVIIMKKNLWFIWWKGEIIKHVDISKLTVLIKVDFSS